MMGGLMNLSGKSTPNNAMNKVLIEKCAHQSSKSNNFKPNTEN
jgi:hypothetical protein